MQAWIKAIIIFLSLALVGCAAPGWEQLPQRTATVLIDAPPGTLLAIACFDKQAALTTGFENTADGWKQSANRGAVFEIGSVTKLFSAYIAVRLDYEGVIQLNEPIGYYVDLPEDIAGITFEDLLTHTSGLPFLPSDLSDMPVINSNPFQGYSADRLLHYLRHNPALINTNNRYRYSNLGYAVLGLVLEHTSGQSYSDLLSRYIIEPYQLNQTTLVRSDVSFDLVAGQNLDGSEADYWDFAAFAASGGLYSSLGDLITFVQAQLTSNPVAAVMQYPHNAAAGYGWALQQHRGRSWLEQTGATGGFTSAVLIQPQLQHGVVVLTNLSGLHPHAYRVAELAEWLLQVDCPLKNKAQ